MMHLKTLSIFKFQSEFKDEITDEEKRINDLGQYKFCKSDPNIKNIFLKRQDVLDAFVWIMIDHYSERSLVMPEIIKDNNEDLIDQDNKDENIIKELFEFTHSYDDYLTVADTNNYIITHSHISKTRYKLL